MSQELTASPAPGPLHNGVSVQGRVWGAWWGAVWEQRATPFLTTPSGTPS